MTQKMLAPSPRPFPPLTALLIPFLFGIAIQVHAATHRTPHRHNRWMDRIETHPMPLYAVDAPEADEVTPWADDVSRPWAETMPAPEPLSGATRSASARARSVTVWAAVASLLGLAAVYLLRRVFGR